MQFKVGNVSAKCAKCGGAEFQQLDRRTSARPQSNFSCAGCGVRTSYSELIMQIGRESARRTKARLSAQRAPIREEAKTVILPFLQRGSPG